MRCAVDQCLLEDNNQINSLASHVYPYKQVWSTDTQMHHLRSFGMHLMLVSLPSLHMPGVDLNMQRFCQSCHLADQHAAHNTASVKPFLLYQHTSLQQCLCLHSLWTLQLGCAPCVTLTTASLASPALLLLQESSSEYSSSEEDSDEEAERRLQAAKEQRQARLQAAMAAGSKEVLRSPICCILGHVDTGQMHWHCSDKLRKALLHSGIPV
jgi:hypothetical protein